MSLGRGGRLPVCTLQGHNRAKKTMARVEMQSLSQPALATPDRGDGGGQSAHTVAHVVLPNNRATRTQTQVWRSIYLSALWTMASFGMLHNV